MLDKLNDNNLTGKQPENLYTNGWMKYKRHFQRVSLYKASQDINGAEYHGPTPSTFEASN